MLTKAEIADIICERLERGAAAPGLSSASRPLPKRVFISDWELKRMMRPGDTSVKIPSNTILSPLSLDWLEYNNIKVIRLT